MDSYPWLPDFLSRVAAKNSCGGEKNRPDDPCFFVEKMKVLQNGSGKSTSNILDSKLFLRGKKGPLQKELLEGGGCPFAFQACSVNLLNMLILNHDTPAGANK